MQEWMRLTLERLCYGLWITRKNGMVQNQVTIAWLDLSPMGSEGFPPSDAIGGRPKRGRQAPWGIATPLRQLRQLAERVEFPEKNATVCQSRASFGGQGQISRESETVRPPADGTYSSFFAGGGAGAPGAGAIFSIFFWAGAGAGAGRTTGPAGRGATVGGGGVILDMLVIMKMNQPK